MMWTGVQTGAHVQLICECIAPLKQMVEGKMQNRKS